MHQAFASVLFIENMAGLSGVGGFAYLGPVVDLGGGFCYAALDNYANECLNTLKIIHGKFCNNLDKRSLDWYNCTNLTIVS